MKLNNRHFIGIVVVVAAIAITVFRRNNGMVYVTSSIDGKNYLVRNTPSKQEAANALSTINQRILKLISHLMSSRPNENSVRLISRRYRTNRTELSEGKSDPQYTTYTVNKGESIVFCLSPRSSGGSVYDINLLMFVALHELAHIGCKKFDNHNAEFQAVFRMLLQEAILIGIYQYRDYRQTPAEYCNLSISSPGM